MKLASLQKLVTADIQIKNTKIWGNPEYFTSDFRMAFIRRIYDECSAHHWIEIFRLLATSLNDALYLSVCGSLDIFYFHTHHLRVLLHHKNFSVLYNSWKLFWVKWNLMWLLVLLVIVTTWGKLKLGQNLSFHKLEAEI